MKGEVRDEMGNALQNVNILLHSTGYVYHSGTTGAFGIVTAKQFDSLTFYADGYQKHTATASATGFISVVLKRAAATKNTHRLQAVIVYKRPQARNTAAMVYRGRNLRQPC
jgi:Ca-activated chloride channel family protein